MAANLESSSIEMGWAREVVSELANRISVQSGDDGMPIVELSLKDQMPQGRLVNGSQIDLMAGA